ncbi:recombination associated protein [Vibrio phage RYC]|nr:recombination associated protein [Vibrio phage RYC]
MFKKFSVYQLSKESVGKVRKVLQEEGEELLEEYKFRACGKADKATYGFVKTFNDNYVSEVNNNIVVSIMSQAKSVNKFEVKTAISVAEQKWIEDNNSDELPKDVVRAIEDAAEREVLQRTFPKEPKLASIVIRPDGQMLVDGKGAASEDLLALLRKALGSLPATPVVTKDRPEQVMKLWFMEEEDTAPFNLGEKAIAVCPDQEVKYTLKGDVYSAQDTLELMGKPDSYIDSLELEFKNDITFTLTSSLSFEGIKVNKALTEDSETNDAANIIIINELCNIVDVVITRLGKPEPKLQESDEFEGF